MKHSLNSKLRWGIYILCLALTIVSCEYKENPPDDDADGIENSVDNCPKFYNPDQADADGDGIGDACEPDTDKDSIIDDIDNCPNTVNPDQADENNNGIGDVCEGDTDEDGIADYKDNCPDTANPDQADVNENGIGDVCEGDSDEDGVVDYLDNCPETPNADQADFDGDGIGDICDETTVVEDQTNIQSSLDDTFICLRNLKNGAGMDLIMEDMLGYADGVFATESWAAAIVENLGSVLEPSVDQGSFRILMSDVGGVYNFNKADSSWTQESTSTSSVVLNFPSIEGGTNNAKLTLANYTDQKFETVDTLYYLPTALDLSLEVDGVETLAASINEIVYGTGDVPLPTKVDVQLFLKPTVFHVVVESITDTHYKADISMENEEGCGYGASVEVKLAHNDYANIVFDTDITYLQGEIRLGALSIATAKDLSAMLGLTDPTEAQINELVDLNVLINGFKVADVEYSAADETLYLIYKEGSKEDAFDYFEDFIFDIINMVEDYTGDLTGSDGEPM